MLLQKGSREDAIFALINTWLSDPTMYCGWCGAGYDAQNPVACCEKPFIANNKVIMKVFYKELIERRHEQNNEFASNDDKTFRVKLTFPAGLLEFLTKGFKQMYGEDLFNKEYDTTWFAKRFNKCFSVAEKI